MDHDDESDGLVRSESINQSVTQSSIRTKWRSRLAKRCYGYLYSIRHTKRRCMLISTLISLSTIILMLFIVNLPTDEPVHDYRIVNTTISTVYNTTQNSRSIDIAIAACGETNREMALTGIKSWLYHQHPNISLNFHLFVDSLSEPEWFDDSINQWPDAIQRLPWSIEYVNVMTRLSPEMLTYINEFHRCASVRLFLTTLLPDLDRVLYVDTDTLMIGRMERVYEEVYAERASAALMGATWEAGPLTALREGSWYTTSPRAFDWVQPWGINSGVLIFHLNQLRQVRFPDDALHSINWNEYVIHLYTHMRSNFSLGDQDLLNHVFSHHPTRLYFMCDGMNYRPGASDFATVGDIKNEVMILHGSSQRFLKEKEAISFIYQYYKRVW